jgi:hypothetical protein
MPNKQVWRVQDDNVVCSLLSALTALICQAGGKIIIEHYKDYLNMEVSLTIYVDAEKDNITVLVTKTVEERLM